MKWVFNQNCQLIIEDWDVETGYDNVFEIVVHMSSGKFGIFKNRTETKQVVDIEYDGLYNIYVVKTNHPIDNLEKKLKGTWDSFREWLKSEEGEIFELEGPVEQIFSICNLRKCAIALERESIEEFLSTCGKKNCNTRTVKHYTRDLLLIAIFVLENLICQGKFAEAENIIESLSSCGTICGNQIKSCCNE